MSEKSVLLDTEIVFFRKNGYYCCGINIHKVSDHNDARLKLSRMISQRLTITLILIMAMMPVVAAFGHYSGKASQVLSVGQIVVADDAGVPVSDHSDHCQPDKSHPASCSFHVCVDCGITSSFWLSPVYSADRYGYLEKFASVSFLFPPDIKPPIAFL